MCMSELQQDKIHTHFKRFIIHFSGTPFMFGMAGNRVQCQGLTKKGEQCKNAAVSGHIACRIHNK